MTSARDLTIGYLERPPRRYLWTDAFALCNLLELGGLDLARALIDSVHHTLGRHRADDARRGWISGLSEAEGEAHPTLGGLRIGKPLSERGAGDRADDRLEWDRDGQYFHYLTKWMHALDRAAGVLADDKLATWSRELAITAHHRFVYGSPRARRMYWKMSIDLSRPQVASMGHHDPLDGYVTCVQLRAARAAAVLDDAIADFRSMIVPDALATTDPLGIGGLLFDAYRLAQLDLDRPLRRAIVDAAIAGVRHFLEQRELSRPADQRLAFRELGLAIGLSAAEPLALTNAAELGRIRDQLVAFWTDPDHRSTRTYREHQDINDVMLATSLAPRGFLAVGAMQR